MQDKINLAVGASRRSKIWENKEMRWADFVDKLSKPVRTKETEAEYAAMKKSDRDEVKDVGGYVGGMLKGSSRKADEVVFRSILTLDIDEATEDPWASFTLAYDCAAVMHSTHSSTADAPRYRMIFPLSRAVRSEEYIAISRRLAADIGIDMVDDTTYEPHRLMYWPSLPVDSTYVFRVQEGPWLNVDEQLDRYMNWQDASQWPQSSRGLKDFQARAKKQGDPTEKPGVIGAFCRVYDIDEAIETFLPDVYLPCPGGRYTYAYGSTAGGLVVYEDGKFAYSHHNTDPASGELCNAFDLVRIHKFGDLDKDLPAGTRIDQKPSYKAMCELAGCDAKVAENLFLHNLDVDGLTAENEWLKDLEVAKGGKIMDTIENLLIIMENDPELKDRFAFDEFHQRPVARGDLPWKKFEHRTSETWTDNDDAGMRWYIELKYRLNTMRKIFDAVNLVIEKKHFHPVRDYLESLTWDGEPRVAEFFIDTLGADDTAYTREVTKRALIGAVARVMEPGCKHDHMLVLVGPQGCGKSTTLMRLGKEWFSDSLFTIAGKDAYEQLQGAWIIEMGEMAATRKSEIEQIKLFISKQTDTFREAYARRTMEFPRQCAFFGTTNDEVFMKDPTGGRRFWPIKVVGLLNDKIDVDQVWAEALAMYKAGEQWHLASKYERLAREQQDLFTEQDDRQGLIEERLRALIPKNWTDLSIGERQAFYQGATFETGETTRNSICALEVWTEILCNDINKYSLKEAREIKAILRKIDFLEPKETTIYHPDFGRQRGFLFRKKSDQNLP